MLLTLFFFFKKNDLTCSWSSWNKIFCYLTLFRINFIVLIILISSLTITQQSTLVLGSRPFCSSKKEEKIIIINNYLSIIIDYGTSHSSNNYPWATIFVIKIKCIHSVNTKLWRTLLPFLEITVFFNACDIIFWMRSGNRLVMAPFIDIKQSLYYNHIYNNNIVTFWLQFSGKLLFFHSISHSFPLSHCYVPSPQYGH